MDEVGITEYVKGDNRKFEIWYAGKEEVYIVQVGQLRIILEAITCLRIHKSEFANKSNFGYITKVLRALWIIILWEAVDQFFN